MLHSLFMLAALVGGISMPLAIDDANQIEDKVEFKQENKRFVVYDDEEYTITLSADELNNYTFTNLTTYLQTLSDDVLISCFLNYGSYNDIELNSSTSDGMFMSNPFTDNDFHIGFNLTYNDTYQDFESFITNRFSFFDGSNDVQDFEYSLEVVFGSSFVTLYNDVKQAIELDIQANQNFQPHLMPVLVEIVSLLTGGIIGIATGVGGGVSDLVTNIFLNNGQLSVFGAIIAVFGGIALAIGLSRWVMNFLTSLGAKK